MFGFDFNIKHGANMSVVGQELSAYLQSKGFKHIWIADNAVNIGGYANSVPDTGSVGRFNLSALSATERPLIGTLNGRKILQFDGVNDNLQRTVTGFNQTDTQGAFLFVARRISGSVGFPALNVYGNNINERTLAIISNSNNGFLITSNGSTYNSFQTSNSFTNFSVFIMQKSGSTVSIYVNGVKQTISPTTTSFWLNTNPHKFIGIGEFFNTTAKAQAEWGLSAYSSTPFNDSTALEVSNVIKTYYGL